MTEIPETAVDIYDVEHIAAPYEAYAQLRGLGSVVLLTRHNLFAIPRFPDVRRAALDFNTFSSASGVAANDYVNDYRARGKLSTTIASDRSWPRRCPRRRGHNWRRPSRPPPTTCWTAWLGRGRSTAPSSSLGTCRSSSFRA